jgi:hypothetical protein
MAEESIGAYIDSLRGEMCQLEKQYQQHYFAGL